MGFLSACDSPNSGESYKPTPEEKQRAIDYNAITSTLRGLGVGFYHENAGDQGTALSDDMFYLNKWQGRNLVDTLIVNSYATQLNFSFSFKDGSPCSYSDIKFILDGKQVDAFEFDKGYGPKYLSIKAPESINSEEHDVVVQMDSLKCENLSQSYHFIPGIPRSHVYTGKSIFASSHTTMNGEKEVCSDKFFIDMYASIYELGSTVVFADTVHSNCYLKKGSDSVMMDLKFETTGITSLSDHSRAQAYMSDAALTKFLKGDSTAVIGCALFYQQSSKFAEPDSVNYTEGNIKFVKCHSHQIDSLTVSDSLRIAAEAYSAYRIFGKVKIKDSYTFFNLDAKNIRYVDDTPCSAYDTTPCLSHSEFAYAFEDICGNDCKQTFDSIQVIIQYINQPYSNLNEALLTIPNKLEFPKDSAFMDSVINILTDSNGNILPDYRTLAAKRISNPLK